MKRILCVLSFVPAVITGILCTFGSGGEFFHLIWLMPLCGLIAGALTKPVLLPCHMGGAALSMVISGLIGDELHPFSMGFLFLAAAALFEVIGYGIGAFGKRIFRGSPSQRIGAGFGALLLLAVLFVPVNAVFGNPVSAMIAKQQLDGCMEAHVDPLRYSVQSFGYDWYDGNYRYRLTDNTTGKRKYLVLYKHKDAIYFSGTDRIYENIWN